MNIIAPKQLDQTVLELDKNIKFVVDDDYRKILKEKEIPMYLRECMEIIKNNYLFFKADNFLNEDEITGLNNFYQFFEERKHLIGEKIYDEFFKGHNLRRK